MVRWLLDTEWLIKWGVECEQVVFPKRVESKWQGGKFRVSVKSGELMLARC